jgi:hypothetical protein
MHICRPEIPISASAALLPCFILFRRKANSRQKGEKLISFICDIPAIY